MRIGFILGFMGVVVTITSCKQEVFETESYTRTASRFDEKGSSYLDFVIRSKFIIAGVEKDTFAYFRLEDTDTNSFKITSLYSHPDDIQKEWKEKRTYNLSSPSKVSFKDGFYQYEYKNVRSNPNSSYSYDVQLRLSLKRDSIELNYQLFNGSQEEVKFSGRGQIIAIE